MKPVTRRFALIVSLLLALSSAKAQVGPSFSLAVPRSESKAVRLIEDLAVHLVLTLGYTESSAAARVWRTEGLASLGGTARYAENLFLQGVVFVAHSVRIGNGSMDVTLLVQQYEIVAVNQLVAVRIS